MITFKYILRVAFFLALLPIVVAYDFVMGEEAWTPNFRK